MDVLKAIGMGILGLLGMSLGWQFSRTFFVAIPINAVSVAFLVACYMSIAGYTFDEAYRFVYNIQLWFLVPGALLWLLEVTVKSSLGIKDEDSF
jgi:hypothetical protein